MEDTVDLPVAIEPVSPIISMLVAARNTDWRMFVARTAIDRAMRGVGAPLPRPVATGLSILPGALLFDYACIVFMEARELKTMKLFFYPSSTVLCPVNTTDISQGIVQKVECGSGVASILSKVNEVEERTHYFHDPFSDTFVACDGRE